MTHATVVGLLSALAECSDIVISRLLRYKTSVEDKVEGRFNVGWADRFVCLFDAMSL